MIRHYHTQDDEAVLQVWQAAALLAYYFMPQSFWATEREDIRTKYLPTAQTWVYELDGVVVGFISLLGSHVGGLFVAPEHQREGIGTRLIEHAMTLHDTLSLDVFEQNIQARRFYEKCGFAVSGESRHEATGYTLLIMHTEQGLPQSGTASHISGLT